MIIASKEASALCIGSFGKDSVGIITIEKNWDLFSIDPKLNKPYKDAFVFSSDNFRSNAARTKLLERAKSKHPAVVIIIIARNEKEAELYKVKDKSGSSVLVDGINEVLVKPKKEVVEETIRRFTEVNGDKIEVDSGFGSGIRTGQKSFKKELDEEPVANQSEIEEDTTDLLPADAFVEPEATGTILESEEDMAERIRNCKRVADVTKLANELKASDIVRELAKKSTTYSNIENNIQALEDHIRATLMDTSRDSEEKLKEVRASIINKGVYREKAVSIVEQHVIGIIDVLTEVTIDLLNNRLTELDKAIVKAKENWSIKPNYARFAGLADERSNLIVELSTLSYELSTIANVSTQVATDTVGILAQQSTDTTGSTILNDVVKVQENIIVSEETLQSLLNVMHAQESKSPKYKEAEIKIKRMIAIINQLFNVDKETIAAQQSIIKFLNEQKIEDTVVATTLLKRACRIFIGFEGSGRTVVPYLLSAMKARTMSNVLTIDLTGCDKYSDYHIHTHDLNDFMNVIVEEPICTVTGSHVCDDAFLQRLQVVLSKAADYYGVINIVIDPSQMDIFDVLVIDTICVNYVTDTNISISRKMRSVIETTKRENVAQRVILNKATNSSRDVITVLGIDERIDLHIVEIPYSPQIIECSLRHVDPATCVSVMKIVKDV